MRYLLLASIFWAFSFGLIKQHLGNLDSTFVAFVRLLFSLLIFLPFISLKNINQKLRLKLMLIGLFQYGLMYVLYIESYQYLKAYEVALFTIFTPLFVIVIDNIITKKSIALNYVRAIISIVGAFLISYDQNDYGLFFTGLFMLQAANVCFAFGQVYYRKTINEEKKLDREVYAWIFLGAMILPFLISLPNISTSISILTESQLFTLLYLGIIPSGLGFYFWNKGAARVRIDTLAVLNNLKIPIALIITVLFFTNENLNIMFYLGSLIIVVSALNKNDISKAFQLIQKKS